MYMQIIYIVCVCVCVCVCVWQLQCLESVCIRGLDTYYSKQELLSNHSCIYVYYTNDIDMILCIYMYDKYSMLDIPISYII